MQNIKDSATGEGASDGLLNKRELAIKLGVAKRTVDLWMQRKRSQSSRSGKLCGSGGQMSWRKPQPIQGELMNSPPKERAAVLGPPIKKLTAQCYHHQDAAQVYARGNEKVIDSYMSFVAQDVGITGNLYAACSGHTQPIGEDIMSSPVENLVERLHAKRSGKGWIAKCPAHNDLKPSLSINEGTDGRALIKCQAGMLNGRCTVTALGITYRDLFPAKYGQPSRNGATPNAAPLFDWGTCVSALTDKYLERLATWRGYSIDLCSWLKKECLIGLIEGCIAFPVHDEAGHIVAAHYRVQGNDNSWYTRRE